MVLTMSGGDDILSRSQSHLQSVGEGYFEHKAFALKYAFGCFQAGFMGLVHAFIPALFESAASKKIKELDSINRNHFK